MRFKFKHAVFGMLILLTYSQSLRLFGQTQIAFQSFEGLSSDNWSYTPVYQNPALPQLLVGSGNYGAGYAFSGTNSLRIGGGSQTCAAGSANCINGASSGGGCNDNQNGAEVAFSAIDVTCYENLILSVAHRTHVLCTSPTFQGQGFDSGDRVYFEVSLNGGAFTSSATVNGFNNCTWDYSTLASCTGPAVTNPFTYAIPAGTNQVAFRVRMQINRSDEVLYLDHVSLSGDLKKSSFMYPSIICASDGFVSPVLESGFNSGGTFSSSAGLVFDPNSGIIDAGNSMPGFYTINYSYGSSVCSTYSFTIYPTPTTTPIYHE